MEDLKSLGEALPEEIQRVMDIRDIYLNTGTAGAFASALMKRSIDRASKAMVSGDVIEMLRCYEDLKSYEL